MVALVRYGMIPEVARFQTGSVDGLERGRFVVVDTHRGLQLGTFLERVHPPSTVNGSAPETAGERMILRAATEADLAESERLQREAQSAYQQWTAHFAEWGLDLELLDLEWTLDGEKLILYVLNERGPDCTKLALQAAAAGLGIIEVQPVTEDGPLVQPTEGGGGGCGSCGCG